MEPASDSTIDPVCGMEVDPVDSLGPLVWHGRAYRFCSIECLEQFDVEPEAFAIDYPLRDLRDEARRVLEIE